LRLSAAEPAGPAADGPDDEVLAAERRTQLVAAVNALPDRERRVLVCRYFLDLSEAETAQVLEWPLGSVKSRTFRALNRLRGRLVAGQQDGGSRGWPGGGAGLRVADGGGGGPAGGAERRDRARELAVPPAASPAAAVRQRLEGPAA